MIALRYICGFFIQIFPYAFFCLYPFWDKFRVSRKKTVIIAFSVLAVLVIPFALIGQFNIGGNYENFFCNIIFYIAILFFLVLYLVSIKVRLAEKLFVFFVVMSYGFFVTRLVSLVFFAFDLLPDKYMYPPMALLLTIVINLIAAKPIMLLMKRVRMMVDVKLEKRIWCILCVVPILFILLASAIYFPEIIPLENDILIPLYSVLFHCLPLLFTLCFSASWGISAANRRVIAQPSVYCRATEIRRKTMSVFMKFIMK